VFFLCLFLSHTLKLKPMTLTSACDLDMWTRVRFYSSLRNNEAKIRYIQYFFLNYHAEFITQTHTWYTSTNCIVHTFVRAWHLYHSLVNPLDSKGNYSATSNTMKLVHWPLMCGLLHLVQREGAWADWGLAQSPPRCTKCNSPPINDQCTNHCSAIW